MISSDFVFFRYSTGNSRREFRRQLEAIESDVRSRQSVLRRQKEAARQEKEAFLANNKALYESMKNPMVERWRVAAKTQVNLWPTIVTVNWSYYHKLINDEKYMQNYEQIGYIYEKK